MSNDWWSSISGLGQRHSQEADVPEQDETITSSLEAESVIVVSNRQPYRHRFESTADGEKSVAVDRPTGGLTAGLDPVMQRLNGTWIAWGDGDADRTVSNSDGQVRVPPEEPTYTLQRVWLSEADVAAYYYGYSNQALWPLCHVSLENTQFDIQQYRRYRAVNETFAETIVEHTTSESVIWFQDYHLACAPGMVREQCGDEQFLLHFWHIPWPTVPVFRICPQARALLKGLLGNDLIGFHVSEYCRNFCNCVSELLEDSSVDVAAGEITYNGRTTAVRAYPMGVDAERIKRRSLNVAESAWRTFKADWGIDPDVRLVLGVDRLDYTKGIPERLRSLERLWEERPRWRGRFTYVQKGSESRSQIEAYQQLQQTVREISARINERFGTDEWQPVVLIDAALSREQLSGLYRYSDVALVTPLRDGMNLVAQEYVAAQVDDDGVLILSELAGSHEQLGDAVLSINPYDISGQADAIERALTMPEAERRHRCRRLRRSVHENDLTAWLEDVFSTVSDCKSDKT